MAVPSVDFSLKALERTITGKMIKTRYCPRALPLPSLFALN